MGLESLPTRTDGQTIDQNWFNTIKSILAIDLFPRNASGVVATVVGSLGSATYKWLNLYSRKAEIETGYWSAGDIKSRHTYNGVVPVGQGWMLCDGRLINETTYNAEHGAGSWATYIGTSLLDAKYLPDLTGSKYLSGVASTAATGSIAIPEVGVAANSIDLAHTHGRGSFAAQVQFTSGRVYLSHEGTGDWSATKSFSATDLGSETARDQGAPIRGTSGSSLSATTSIQPRSIEVQYYMRII